MLWIQVYVQHATLQMHPMNTPAEYYEIGTY